MGLIMAIILRNDNLIPQYLKDNIHVCQVGGHITCCIGAPSEETSLIVDPWISYLDLPKKKDYRDKLSSWDNVERKSGFIGGLADYCKFLTTHPNQYTPDELEFKIYTHPNFSKISTVITLQEINSIFERYNMPQVLNNQLTPNSPILQRIKETKAPPNSPQVAKQQVQKKANFSSLMHEFSDLDSPIHDKFGFSDTHEASSSHPLKIKIRKSEKTFFEI